MISVLALMLLLRMVKCLALRETSGQAEANRRVGGPESKFAFAARPKTDRDSGLGPNDERKYRFPVGSYQRSV